MRISLNSHFIIPALTVFLVLVSCSGSRITSQKAEAPTPAIIPLPQTVQWADNEYLLPNDNVICFSKDSKTAAQWLQELLRKSGKAAEIVSGNACGNFRLSMDRSLEKGLGKEGYILDHTKGIVTIEAATEAGLFYGIQSLRQIFPPEIEQAPVSGDIYLREVHIKDSPRYSWRGTMVDVSRSFFGPEYLKQHIDRMALYKLNRLHLHLSDDQGWRIEIKSKPKLTEIGSKGAVTGGQAGYLTQEEYIDLQNYAVARNIVIIPEIDMPGHIYAALIAYPELNCDQYTNLTPARATPPDPFPGHEVGWSKFCLEKPEIYDFVSEVIGELAKITKGPWIHIGGDEIDDPLYEEFVVKADSIVRQYEKTTIGWEEVTKAKVSEDLISQQWHGKVKSEVEVKKIYSLCSQFYLDHANIPGQEKTNNWCKKSGVSIEDVYSFKSDDPDVLGVEAPVWTEHVHNAETLDDRFWPRSLAVAEVAWTEENNRNFPNFKQRVEQHKKRLGSMGVFFFDWQNFENLKTADQQPNSVFSGFLPAADQQNL